jgi:L-threonylcarbamoyladenylate synthase
MPIISKCSAFSINDAARSLINGNLVAFPTETVYGLGADACNEKAVARIYAVKGRPINHPLIIHISSINNLDKWARDIPDYAIKLAKNFWPGPMTLILPRTNLAKDFITGGQDNVGIRVPVNTYALSLLQEFEAMGGLGVSAPSANRFGALSPTNAQAVSEELKNFMSASDLILDGGSCEVGIESTIIDCLKSKPKILRPGAITLEMVERIIHAYPTSNINSYFNDSNSKEIRVPGMAASHYAPKAKVIIGKIPIEGQGMIALKLHVTPKGVVRLASPQNDLEFANILYEALRCGDRKGLSEICVIPPTSGDLTEAIVDRLFKASNDR